MDNYTSDSSDSESNNRIIDLAYLLRDPDAVDKSLEEYLVDSKKYEDVEKIILHHNELNVVPKNLSRFINMKVLDISNNGLTALPNIFQYCQLTNLILKNNRLQNDTLPKEFTVCPSLKELNLSGNILSRFPEQIFSFPNLKFLYLGGNGMKNISKDVGRRLKQLQVLSLGGNNISEVPLSVGFLQNLQALVLCDNNLESLPANIANLLHLKSLLLHRNKLRTLPPQIIALKNLTELSLRDNPLVVRFVSDITYQPPSLLELSARAINLYNITVKPGDIPQTVIDYMESAHRCLNPDCKAKELESNNTSEKLEADRNLVKQIVEIACPQVKLEEIKILRIGAEKANKTRPLRLRLPAAENVRDIIYNVNKLRSSEALSGMAFSFDRTPAQIEEYKTLRAELLRRTQDGENGLKIKYFNGIPKITMPKNQR